VRAVGSKFQSEAVTVFVSGELSSAQLIVECFVSRRHGQRPTHYKLLPLAVALLGAGIAGGVIGLVFNPAGYPTAAFFAVSVMVGTYHIFSEWLSLIVKTRSSQAVKRLLDLQPETARVVRGTQELEVPIEEVTLGDLVRIRPGERIPADGIVVSGHSGVDQSLVTGEAIPGYPILQKGNGKDSNIIEALSGITPFNHDPFPRMPAPTGPTSTRRRSTQSPLGIDAGANQ